jgi:3-phenylpropionate/trans-cinnamate dioxygenase ferredoxin reductase component
MMGKDGPGPIRSQ